MKSFLKYTLATITGLFITGILFFFVSLASLSLMMATADKPVSISSNSILVLNTGLMIPERGIADPFSSFDPLEFTFKPSAGINDILSNLDKAANDDKVEGVLIKNGPMYNGWGKAAELRDALIEFKKSGKFIISYTDYILTQEAYYISTAADKIYLNPNAMMEFKGIAGEVMFYKNALDKIGVNVQVVRHGKYKGAVERYMLDRLSDENRAQIKAYTSGIWNHAVNTIAEARGISTEELNSIADGLKALDLDFSLESGIIDGLLYKDELLDELKKLSATEDDKKPDYVSMAKYSKVEYGDNEKSDSRIAVLYAEGTIMMGSGTSTSIGGDKYSKVIRDIREKGKHDALVLRISSPGGNAMASDHIWHELELLAKDIPVVVSMSNYAASGGYYIAAPAAKIVAQPTTITGSIGVFGLIPEGSSLLEDKLGITTDVVKTNEFADYPSVYRSMTDYEIKAQQASVDRTYEDFVEIVSNGRNIDKDEVDAMGGGQVYTGSDAIAKNLVDELGGMKRAMELAAELADLESYEIEEFPKIEDAYTKLLKSLTGELRMKVIRKELGPLARAFDNLKELESLSGVQARLPYAIDLR